MQTQPFTHLCRHVCQLLDVALAPGSFLQEEKQQQQQKKNTG